MRLRIEGEVIAAATHPSITLLLGGFLIFTPEPLAV
jgi:hypothetical protein